MILMFNHFETEECPPKAFYLANNLPKEFYPCKKKKHWLKNSEHKFINV